MPVYIYPSPSDGASDQDFAPWRGIPVAIAADASTDIRVIDPAIRPLGPDGRALHLFGRAVTAWCEPPDFGAVLHAIDVVRQGDVLVIAAGGDCSFAVIGEILCGHLRNRGCAGLVCDGAVRDADLLGSWRDFPVYARGITPRGPSSAERGAVNLSVRIGDCTISPGDLIMGDRDGLVSLSPVCAISHLDAARAKLEKEAGWIDALASGLMARDTFGLPTPEWICAIRST